MPSTRTPSGLFIALERSAPRTKEFNRRLLAEIASHEPLMDGKGIELVVDDKNLPPPEFTEIPVEHPENKNIPISALKATGIAIHDFYCPAGGTSSFAQDKMKVMEIRVSLIQTQILIEIYGSCRIEGIEYRNYHNWPVVFYLRILDSKRLREVVKAATAPAELGAPPDATMEQLKALALARVYYDPESGLGYANGKTFKFATKTKGAKVFAALYTNVGRAVPRGEILDLIGYRKSEGALGAALDAAGSGTPLDKKLGTYAINELAKTMREITDLNTEQLVLNGGDLTLRGEKLPLPPTAPQKDPK